MASGSYMHRRPSYAQREKQYPRRNRTGKTRHRTLSDFGIDNYAYYEDHVEKFEIPAHLLEKLPKELKDSATEWQYAGAAVCSGLDRIKDLDDQSIYRGYPEAEMFSHPHLTRRVSKAQPPANMSVAGVDTPPMSSPDSSAPASFTGAKPSLLPLEKVSSYSGLYARQVVDVESPPFTPVDSQTCPTPDYPRGMPIANNAMPDVNALTRQLSPISIRARGDSTTSSQSSNAVFDESAWDVYINSFNAEMHDLKAHTLQRVKGLSGQIERFSLEYGRDPKFEVPVKEFAAWWDKNKGRLVKWEVRVRNLEAPTIEYVRKERLAMGLSI